MSARRACAVCRCSTAARFRSTRIDAWTWWVWDARLTSELILLFLYLGIIGLHNAIEDRRIAARAMADARIAVGEGEYREALRGIDEALAIDQRLEAALERFPFLDGDRVAAAGASYGGHLVNWLEATTDRYRCLVSHAGLASLDMQWSTSDVIYHRELMMGGPFWEDPEAWLDQSPLARAGAFRTPMLMSIGETDHRVPLNNTIAMWSALMRMNASLTSAVGCRVWPARWEAM